MASATLLDKLSRRNGTISLAVSVGFLYGAFCSPASISVPSEGEPLEGAIEKEPEAVDRSGLDATTLPKPALPPIQSYQPGAPGEMQNDVSTDKPQGAARSIDQVDRSRFVPILESTSTTIEPSSSPLGPAPGASTGSTSSSGDNVAIDMSKTDEGKQSSRSSGHNSGQGKKKRFWKGLPRVRTSASTSSRRSEKAE